MKVNWRCELFTWAQYFFFSFVAATAALLYQAAYDFDRTNDLSDGIISCFAYREVLKGSGVYYGWLLGLFFTLSSVRFLILFVMIRTRVKLP
jgi:hypothetical protein